MFVSVTWPSDLGDFLTVHNQKQRSALFSAIHCMKRIHITKHPAHIKSMTTLSALVPLHTVGIMNIEDFSS